MYKTWEHVEESLQTDKQFSSVVTLWIFMDILMGVVR